MNLFFIRLIAISIIMSGVFTLLPSVANAQSESFFNNQSEVQYGLPAGVVIPEGLHGLGKDGEDKYIKDLYGEEGAVVMFVRSVLWCKYGRFFLEDVARKGRMIEDTGYKIIIISNDSLTNLERFYDNERFPYTVIADEKSEIIKAFGLMNTNYQPGTIYYGVAHPAIYIIDKDGTIQDKFFNVDMSVMKSVDDIRDAVYDVKDSKPIVQ